MYIRSLVDFENKHCTIPTYARYCVFVYLMHIWSVHKVYISYCIFCSYKAVQCNFKYRFNSAMIVLCEFSLYLTYFWTVYLHLVKEQGEKL